MSAPHAPRRYTVVFFTETRAAAAQVLRELAAHVESRDGVADFGAIYQAHPEPREIIGAWEVATTPRPATPPPGKDAN